MNVYDNILFSLPDVSFDEGDPIENGKRYLDSLIGEIRGENPGSFLTWQLLFDMVRFQHSRGLPFIVDCGLSSTRIWLLKDSQDQSKGSKGSIPRPEPGQFVVYIPVGYTSLTGDELIRALASITAERVMSG